MYFTTSSLFASASRILPEGVGRSIFPNQLRSTRRRTGQCLSRLVALPLVGLFVLGLSAQTWAQGNVISTVAGGSTPSGAATAADIPGPSAVAGDASGNIYIAPPNSYYVFKVAPSGTISVFAGVGIQGYCCDGGPANKAALISPSALFVDSAGNVYIADSNRVREVTTDGNINTIAGTGQACSIGTDACGDGGPATQAMLNIPQGLFVDSLGNVYIADTMDQRIRLVTKSTGVITTVAGNGQICDGPTQGCGDKYPATLASLDMPIGVAVDASNNIYIGDQRDQRIRLVTSSTGKISTYAGTGQYCLNPTSGCGDGGSPQNANFYNPSGVWLDSAGNLYVADQLDQKIRKITPGPSGIITTVAGNGTQGFFGDGSVATNAELNLPYGVFLDTAGNLWIADTGNQRIREVASGNINTLAGGGSGGDGGAPLQATLANPVTVVWDSAGNYYIADSANNRIRKVSAGSHSIITTVAGNGNSGFGGDGGPATSALLNLPSGVATDAAGDLFIADTNNFVIREIAAGTGNISTIAGTPGVQCTPNTAKCGDGGPATSAQLVGPTSVAIDSNNNLYIADNFGNRVRHVNLTTGIIDTTAGTGVRGSGGDNGPATSATLAHPFSVTVDASGNVYVADSQGNRVRCVVMVSGGCGGSQQAVGNIIAYALNGGTGYGGDGGLAVKAVERVPLGAAMDPAGNLFLGGGAFGVVRRVDAATRTIDTVAGNPQYGGFGGDGGTAKKAQLDNIGMSVNSGNSLLIADTGNNRIRQVNLAAAYAVSPTKLNFPPTPVGQKSSPMSVKLTNTGAADLKLGTFQITGTDAGDFQIAGTTCSTLLAPDTSCSVSVTFTPTQKGTRTADLGMKGVQQTIPLSGTGE